MPVKPHDFYLMVKLSCISATQAVYQDNDEINDTAGHMHPVETRDRVESGTKER